jgi:hypothetical protein
MTMNHEEIPPQYFELEAKRLKAMFTAGSLIKTKSVFFTSIGPIHHGKVFTVVSDLTINDDKQVHCEILYGSKKGFFSFGLGTLLNSNPEFYSEKLM